MKVEVNKNVAFCHPELSSLESAVGKKDADMQISPSAIVC